MVVAVLDVVQDLLLCPVGATVNRAAFGGKLEEHFIGSVVTGAVTRKHQLMGFEGLTLSLIERDGFELGGRGRGGLVDLGGA